MVTLTWRYPLVETAAGLLAVVVFLRYGLSWLFAVYIIMAYWALLLATIDIEHQRLPESSRCPASWSVFFNIILYLQSGVVHVTARCPSFTWHLSWLGNSSSSVFGRAGGMRSGFALALAVRYCGRWYFTLIASAAAVWGGAM